MSITYLTPDPIRPHTSPEAVVVILVGGDEPIKKLRATLDSLAFQTENLPLILLLDRVDILEVNELLKKHHGGQRKAWIMQVSLPVREVDVNLAAARSSVRYFISEKTEYLLFVDCGDVVGKEFNATMLAEIKKDPKIGYVQPPVYHTPLDAEDYIVQSFLYQPIETRFLQLYQSRMGEICVGAYRVKALNDVGWFTPEVPMTIEEIHVKDKLVQAGYRLVNAENDYCSAYVWSRGNGSTSSRIARSKFYTSDAYVLSAKDLAIVVICDQFIELPTSDMTIADRYKRVPVIFVYRSPDTRPDSGLLNKLGNYCMLYMPDGTQRGMVLTGLQTARRLANELTDGPSQQACYVMPIATLIRNFAHYEMWIRLKSSNDNNLENKKRGIVSNVGGWSYGETLDLIDACDRQQDHDILLERSLIVGRIPATGKLVTKVAMIIPFMKFGGMETSAFEILQSLVTMPEHPELGQILITGIAVAFEKTEIDPDVLKLFVDNRFAASIHTHQNTFLPLQDYPEVRVYEKQEDAIWSACRVFSRNNTLLEADVVIVMCINEVETLRKALPKNCVVIQACAMADEVNQRRMQLAKSYSHIFTAPGIESMRTVDQDIPLVDQKSDRQALKFSRVPDAQYGQLFAVIPNPVRTEADYRLKRFEKQEAPVRGLGSEAGKILHMGRFDPAKNVNILGKVSNLLSPKNAIYNTIPRTQINSYRLQQFIVTYPRMRFLECQVNIAPILQNVTAMLSLSPKEAFGNSMFEAMLFDVPLFAVKTGFLLDYEFKDGEHFIEIEPNANAEEVAAKLSVHLDSDYGRKNLAAMAERAKAWIVDHNLHEKGHNGWRYLLVEAMRMKNRMMQT